MSAIATGSVIRVGEYRFVLVPSPSWPLVLSPQAQKVPSRFTARTCRFPAETAVQSCADVTLTGALCTPPSAAPVPSWPSSFRPQAQRVPSTLMAKEVEPPAAIAVQSLAVPIRAGALLAAALPSWPLVLSPQAQRLPSAFSARVWNSP